jgi:predicted dehydrogenase
MTRLRVALIGCGGRGRGHLKTLREFGDVELIALCDPVATARDAAGEAFGVGQRYATVDELLDKEQPDAVFVATPAHLNAPAALLCLQRGIHTLLEKPPGMCLAETRQLRDAAVQTRAKGMVGWNRRFHPLIAQARAAIESQGPIIQLVGEFHKSMAALEGSGRFPEIVMDNMLLETPIHAIDVVRAMAGAEVKEVHAITRRALSRYKDVHAALVLFENGCVAQLTANYTTGARLERYEIHGQGISAYLEGVSQGTLVSQGETRALSDSGDGGMRAQARFFLDCVKEDRPIDLPAANLDEAMKTMALAEAILNSVRD